MIFYKYNTNHQSTVTQQHGYTTARLHNSTVTHKHDNTTARLHISTVTQQHGCKTARLHSSTVGYITSRLHNSMVTQEYRNFWSSAPIPVHEEQYCDDPESQDEHHQASLLRLHEDGAGRCHRTLCVTAGCRPQGEARLRPVVPGAVICTNSQLKLIATSIAKYDDPERMYRTGHW